MIRVMIAEDCLVLGDILAEILVKSGYDVCGIACTVNEAIELGLSRRPHLAILDLRLADGRPATEVATRLTALGRLGVLYSSGNISRVTLTAADGHACLSKPYSARALLRSLEIVMSIVDAKTVSPPFPYGFRILSSSPVLDLGPSFRL